METFSRGISSFSLQLPCYFLRIIKNPTRGVRYYQIIAPLHYSLCNKILSRIRLFGPHLKCIIWHRYALHIIEGLLLHEDLLRCTYLVLFLRPSKQDRLFSLSPAHSSFSPYIWIFSKVHKGFTVFFAYSVPFGNRKRFLFI